MLTARSVAQKRAGNPNFRSSQQKAAHPRVPGPETSSRGRCRQATLPLRRNKAAGRRPRCPSPAPDAHATAPPPGVPLERRSSPSAARATWPHGRAANRPAALPTPPSRRQAQAPDSSLPSIRPRSTSVWRAPRTARAKHKAPRTGPNERSETPPGTIRRLLPRVCAPKPGPWEMLGCSV